LLWIALDARHISPGLPQVKGGATCAWRSRPLRPRSGSARRA